jgi:hypothetical protein
MKKTMQMEHLEQLAVYIKYVLRPRRVLHFSTDHGAFAQHCERIGLDALAIDCNKVDNAKCSNVLYRDWHQTNIDLSDIPDVDENLENMAPLLVLVTDIPQEGIYTLYHTMLENWTRMGTRLWLMDNNRDRWISDLGYMSFIVDIDATAHAIGNLPSKSVIFKRTY